jgi:hypothetical protein
MSLIPKSTTPKVIEAEVAKLLDYLELDPSTAARLKYTAPTTFTPELSMCHFNAWLQHRDQGGSVQIGWILWQMKELSFCEAMFHAVWVSPENQLVDVTPRQDGEEEVLFVPDDRFPVSMRVMDGAPVIDTFDNIQVMRGEVKQGLREIRKILPEPFLRANGLWDGRWLPANS